MSESDDDTILLADGTRINTRTGRPIYDRDSGEAPGYVEVPTHLEAQRAVVNTRKRIADLPELPERMNIVAAVAAYYLFGLDEFQTSLALGCTETQVENIKMTDAFTNIVDAMTQNITQGAQDTVRGLIDRNAMSAAQRVAHLMNSQDEKVAIVAAKDMLDRAGHRPADVVEHKHTVEGGLTIQYVRKTDEEMPVINLTPEEDT